MKFRMDIVEGLHGEAESWQRPERELEWAR
jgi:hypothetical protein